MKVDIFTTENKYDIIYADPPWRYEDKNCNGACAQHYKTLSVKSMGDFPVSKIAKKDSVLFMWATYPQSPAALELIKAWGFKYKSIAFQWVKLNRTADKEKLLRVLQNNDSLEEALHKICFFGLGRWTRGNTECCLIATKGKPRRINNSVNQLVFAPLTRHSEKPPEIRDRIKQLMGDLPCIELFARQAVEGWDCWGDEV